MAKKVPKSGDGTGRTSMTQSRKAARSARTSEFVRSSEAKKHPKTTVTETIKKSPTKKK
jgi:hypothetical protein